MAYSRLTNTAIGTNSDYYLRLYWEETVNVAANKSVVNVRLCGYTDRSKGICSFNQYGTNSIKITIDGTESTLTSQNIDTRDWSGSEKVLHTASKEITHNNDGTKSIAISGSIVYQGGGSSLVAGTYTTSVSSQALTTIARASTIGTVSNTAITSSSGNVTINISKKNSAYYDKITTTGAISKTINVGTGTSGTISWSDLLAAMPSTSSATLNITVSTYSNSGYTTLIGSNTGKATITINTSNIKPSISWGSIAVNSGGLSGKLVAGKSTAKATWTVTNAKGASVSSVTVSATNGSIGSGASSTSTSGTPTTAVLPSKTSNYNLTLTATVKDSRGATATATTSAATVYGYAPPNLTLTAYRTATNSSTAQDPTGAYVYTTWSASVGSTVGGSNAIASTTKTPSSITSGGHYALATNATQAFTVTVKDTVGSTTSKTVNIGTALIPFDLYSNAAGTSVGVGFGKMATAGKVASSLPIQTDSSMYTGGKSSWNSEEHGIYLGGDGTMHLAHESQPYIGFHYGNNASTTASIAETSSGVLNIAANNVVNVNGNPVATTNKTVNLGVAQDVTGYKAFNDGIARKSTGNWPEIDFQGLSNANTSRTGSFGENVTNGYTQFYLNSYQMTDGVAAAQARDAFWFPRSSTDGVYHDWNILTSKELVTVQQGGTNANNAASARANLGVNQPTLKNSIQIAGNATGTFNVTTANYNFYLFKFALNGVDTTIFTVRDLLDATPTTYWVNDGTSSGAGMIITRTASTITVKRDGSTSCWCRLAYWN